MDTSKKTKRKIQSEATYQRLLNVIYDLMGQKNYHDITIDEICENAGIAKGTFYYYFKSKQEILLHLCRKANDDIVSELAFDESKSARELFDHYIDIISSATVRITSSVHARMLIALMTSGSSESVQESNPQFEYVRKILRHGQTRGEISARVNIDNLNQMITASIQGLIVFWTIDDGKFDFPAALRQIMSSIWIN